MTPHNLPRLRATGLASAALLATGSVGLALGGDQNPAVGATTTAQELTAELFCEEVVDEGQEAFLVDVKGTLGPPQVLQFNICFVIDISTTMGQTDLINPVGDANGDGAPNQRIDAAILGLEALAASLAGTPNVDFSLVAFAKDAAILDLSPNPGQQTWISNLSQDDDALNGPDFNEVLRGLDTGGLGQINVSKFTQYDWEPGTDYTEALLRANDAFALQPPGEVNICFFISDGLPNQNDIQPTWNQPGGPVFVAQAAGTRINTFGVGPEVATICDPGQPLDFVASTTGGTCNAVTDPGNLVAVLGNASKTEISKVELCVNGNLVATKLGPDENMLSLGFTDAFPFLNLGLNLIEGKVYAADGTVVTASKTVDKTACLLFVGLNPTNVQVDGIDHLLVDFALWFNVTEAVVPTFQIPAVPELVGMNLYMQVGMHNGPMFPNNAIQMSNGTRLTIGQEWKVYGSATGIWHWIDGGVMPGDAFTPRFDVLGM